MAEHNILINSYDYNIDYYRISKPSFRLDMGSHLKGLI